MPIRELIALALRGLPAMQLPSGLFCLERAGDDLSARGRSIRYSLMAYLGLRRAISAGYETELDADRIWAALVQAADDEGLRPGDHGLYLWAASVAGADPSPFAKRLEQSLSGEGRLEEREGMEVAWVAIGTAETGVAPELLAAARTLLLDRNRGRSGLLYHRGVRGTRRRFPNFATQIYGVLALVRLGELGRARETADRLLELQQADGGWPWLYDADRGRVVERYEVYSVHQHAMAPMALLELTEASDDPRYARAATRGLAWVHGQNELGRNLVAPEHGLVYRSIRRRRPWDRVALYVNTASATLTGRPFQPAGRRALEINETCRPYELGWLLEAWSGRERFAET